MKKIKIYTTPTCSYCHRAKDLLRSLDLEFEEVDVESDPKKRTEIIEKYQWMTVPAIFIDGTLIGGYDDLAKLNADGKLKNI